MMRRYEPFLLFALLAACAPPEHLQSMSSTGFGTGATGYGAPAYGAGSALPAPGLAPAAQAQSSAVIPSSEINSALFGTPNAPGGAASAPAAAAPLALPPAATAAAPAAGQPAPAHTGISDEQDFQAVSSRETIETDKARIAANKAQYQQIAPTALPERTGDSDATKLINYAVNAPNRLGQAVYQRRTVSPDAHQRACLRYSTAEAAQLAFLKAGGPERDNKKLDPDGDGFACGWDPTPFQKARGG
jgi:hypothetical protein